jgi:hypothetical protein
MGHLETLNRGADEYACRLQLYCGLTILWSNHLVSFIVWLLVL